MNNSKKIGNMSAMSFRGSVEDFLRVYGPETDSYPEYAETVEVVMKGLATAEHTQDDVVLITCTKIIPDESMRVLN